MYDAAVLVTQIRHPPAFAEGGLLTHSHLFGTAFGVTHEQSNRERRRAKLRSRHRMHALAIAGSGHPATLVPDI